MQPWVRDARLETPGVEHVVHFDNAGAALPPRVVVDTMVDHLHREAEIGGYQAAAEAASRVDAVYDSIADLIGAAAEEIAVVENATRAWDMAVYGFPFRPGDRVLTARAEYVSNVVALLQLQRRHGIEIVLIDDDEHGQVSLDHLGKELSGGAAVVALTHVPTSGGLVNPAAEVGELCRRHGAVYVLDACQSAGQVPLDVGTIGCDVLSATGRKYLRGPRGVGFLYAGPRALERIEPPLLDLRAADWTADGEYRVRADARRFENWETNYAAKLGLGAAVDNALAVGVERSWPRVEALGAMLREGLTALAGVHVHDKGPVRCGIVTFTVDGMTAPEVTDELRREGINTSVSPVEYARLDLGARGLAAVVRASVHYYNTEDEVDLVVDAVARARGRRRDTAPVGSDG